MSSSAAASTEEFIELLSAEQYVDLQKLRDYARHGVQSTVRGEVWLYLLGVLSDDKSQEMTSVRSKYIEYDTLDKHSDLYEKRIQAEAARYYQKRLVPRPPPGLHRISLQGTHSANAWHPSDDTWNKTKTSSSSDADSAGDEGRTLKGTTINPNRVDDGQQRVLAGIMGGSLSADLATKNGQTSKDGQVLSDSETASANEMKRFCSAVEDIICAHLNRWKWRNMKGSTGFLPATQDQQKCDSNGQNAGDRGLSTANAKQDGEQITNSTQSLSVLPEECERAHEPSDIPRKVSAASLAPASTNERDRRRNIPKNEARQIYQPEYHPDLVVLCAPFVMCIRSEAGMYFAFEQLMSLVEQYNAKHPLPARIATFLTLFRTTLPELYAYFDEEEVDVIGLASAWLRHLLAAEMRIENLMRLWDTYFAVPDPLDLHMYVCLAILTNCKDALEELDQSEAKSMLFSLPPLDVDRIINEAINIRLAHRQAEMLNVEDEEKDGEGGERDQSNMDDDDASGNDSDGDGEPSLPDTLERKATENVALSNAPETVG